MTAPFPVRKVPHDFDRVPRRFAAGGNPVLGLECAALQALFPEGERFFISSMRKVAPRLADPALREQVQAFCGQEAAHAKEHRGMCRMLERHGYSLGAFDSAFEKRLAWLERHFSPAFCVAITSGAEHLTHAYAAETLRGRLFDQDHPVIRDLHYWHAAEEIEHKEVAFAVLQALAPGRYLFRAAGFLVAIAFIGWHYLSAYRGLAAHDALSRRERREGWRAARRVRPHVASILLRSAWGYLRPDHRPGELHDAHLASDYFAALYAGAAS